MTISLKALVKLLLKYNYRFVIEKCDDPDLKIKNVVRFVTSNEYPYSPHTCLGTGDEIESVMRDRRNKKDGFILVHLDLDQDQLLSVNTEIHSRIKSAARTTKTHKST